MKEKLKVELFVPLSVCACQWDKFMNRVFEVMTPYIKHIDYDTIDLHSERAKKLGVHGNSIVINGSKKFSSSYSLKRQLPTILEECGLIEL